MLFYFPVGVDCPKFDQGRIADLNNITSMLLSSGTQDFKVKSKAEGETFCPVEDGVIVWNTYVP